MQFTCNFVYFTSFVSSLLYFTVIFFTPCLKLLFSPALETNCHYYCTAVYPIEPCPCPCPCPTELMNCEELHAILHLVLQAGNIMNAVSRYETDTQ